MSHSSQWENQHIGKIEINELVSMFENQIGYVQIVKLDRTIALGYCVFLFLIGGYLSSNHGMNATLTMASSKDKNFSR
ncbi:hypothetical protein K450DRAFT_228485 [Umbelopsis ramanniana AG]|uniref:Uncharacterized protein n=1 Tax=Umbelopsis ramanniana AG TaxID=1314678 RepID=A0AAD5EEC0_UMBRA|nr:uncharacterized protein K450DRAFT_228485 [Umbelopsis ramanniana AG]KAI8582328.1 hypothetical protein K450DRAFT_228485 [Umbelopsis ramanniana AG]